jgi:hypothetical protein
MAEAVFIDAALFFCQQSGHVRLLRHDPENFSFWEYHELLAVNAFPDSLTPFYAFNFDDHLCFCHSFQVKSDTFTIVVITSQFFPDLYWAFFKALVSDFEQSPDPVTPECRFLIISSLLKSWRIANGNQIFVQSSSDLQYVTLDAKLACFANFNPFRVLDPGCGLLPLWVHVVGGHPIRVVGRSAETVAYAVFGLASLTFPFPYRNKVVLAATNRDPRILAGDFADCSIIGFVTARRPADDGRFAASFSVSAGGAADPGQLQRELRPKSLQFVRLMEAILAAQLSQDPYSDYLQLPFTDPAVIRSIPERDMRGLISGDELRDFEATATARRGSD